MNREDEILAKLEEILSRISAVEARVKSRAEIVHSSSRSGWQPIQGRFMDPPRNAVWCLPDETGWRPIGRRGGGSPPTGARLCIPE